MWQSLKYDFTVVAICIICITLQMTERFWTIFFLVLRFDIATLTDHRRETTTQDSSRSERELGQALARDGHGVLSQSCLSRTPGWNIMKNVAFSNSFVVTVTHTQPHPNIENVGCDSMIRIVLTQ